MREEFSTTFEFVDIGSAREVGIKRVLIFENYLISWWSLLSK